MISVEHRTGIGPGDSAAAAACALSKALPPAAALKRPHVVFSDELSADTLSAVKASYPGSGDRTVPLSSPNWETITDAMAETTISGTAAPAHLEGIDFAGKTELTAQVVNHSAGATKPGEAFEASAPTPGSSGWPRAATRISWSPSCGNTAGGVQGPLPVAAQVINAFVTKQRRRDRQTASGGCAETTAEAVVLPAIWHTDSRGDASGEARRADPTACRQSPVTNT